MTKVISLAQIKECIHACADEDLIHLIEAGFVEYSLGNVVVPPVGHMSFKNPPGDLHIKYGYIHDDNFYVIKIASGFYENPKIGLNSSNGLMLVFNKKTGELLSILLDEGYLTDVRTALAGAVVAKHMAPLQLSAIGIVGTGIQARLQLRYLTSVTTCRTVFVWGRSQEKMNDFKTDPRLSDFTIYPTTSLRELSQKCNLIVTTTPATSPLLMNAAISDGTHITAVGADAPGKQELESSLFTRASAIVVDSAAQCIDHGEVYHAINEKKISSNQLTELGTYIVQKKRKDNGITIADLTGVAVQDIQIAKYVYQKIITL